MKVFVSWSGEASRRVAALFRKYLPCMIQDLALFMSQHDLTSGRRWSEQLSKELEESNFGIVCLTPENLQSPWILLEAGALTKHVEGRACCVLLRELGPADVSGPLSQFQNRVFSRDGLQKLLFDMNALLERPLEPASLQLRFDKWWGDLDREVAAALADPHLSKSAGHKREQADILEELLLRVRNIQQALESGWSPEPVASFSRNVVRDALNLAMSRLSTSQLALLREFVTPAGNALVIGSQELEAKHSKADIETLMQFGLLARSGNDYHAVHSAVTKYLAERLAAH